MFTIDKERNIRFIAGFVKGLSDIPDDAEGFDSEEQLLSIADAQNLSREDLEAIWNGFAGVVPFDNLKPVKKFRNRPYGVKMIWNAVQRLNPAFRQVEQTIAGPLPSEESKVKKPKQARARKPVAKKTTVPRKKAVSKEASHTPRNSGTSKRDQVVEMLKRKSGATVDEIMERMGWKKSAASGILQWIEWGARLGIKSFTSEKNGKGERVYKAA